jgi:hypothetical protein
VKDTFTINSAENYDVTEISCDVSSYAAKLKGFLSHLLEVKEPTEAARDTTLNERPLFVFVSKKGYWAYRLIERSFYSDGVSPWEDALRGGRVEVKSDRYFTKMVSPEEQLQHLERRRIYVVDDFLIKGHNIGHFCRLMRDKAVGSRIIPAVFATWKGFRAPDDVPEFENLYSYIPSASMSEIGHLSTWETQNFHRAGIPYVIDLPFLTIKNSTPARLKSFFSGTLTGEQFQHIQNTQDSAWKCVDNSYVIGDYSTKNCFFYFSDDLFVSRFQNLIQNLVVKCQYDGVDNETVSVTFTPFAVLRSVRQDELITWFRIAYGKTEYGQLVERYMMASSTKSDDENLNTALYRSIVFFFSRYISIHFKNFLKRQLGVELDLCTVEMENHWSAEFIRSLPGIFGEGFQSRLRCLYGQHDITPYVPTYPEGPCRRSINMYYDIFSYFAFKKMAGPQQQFCSLEELENEMALCSGYTVNDADFRTEFTSALLQLLNQGVISNKVSFDLDTGVVRRGFQAGENNTLLLPFNQKAVFSAIYTYYKRMEDENSCRGGSGQNAHELYFRNYPAFKSRLISFVKASELDSYFDLQEAEDTLSYFEMVDASVLTQQVENKEYIITDMEQNDSIDAQVAKLLKKCVQQMYFE